MSMNAEQKKMEIVDRLFENVKAVLVRSLDRDDKLGKAQVDLRKDLDESLANITAIARACPFAITRPIWSVMGPVKKAIIEYYADLRYPEYCDKEFMDGFLGDIMDLIEAARIEILPVEYAAELQRELHVENKGLPYANEGMEHAQKTGLLSALRAKFVKKDALQQKMNAADANDASRGNDDSLGVMPDE